jgi:formylglycine-generating enzyme
MNRKNFSLKDIQLLSDHYSQAGSPEPVALFQIIQGFYPSGQAPDSVDSISFETLVKKVKSSGSLSTLPEKTEDQKSWLNSVRKKMNSELLALMSERGNPCSLSADSDFTIIQLEETTEMGPAVQHLNYKESEITSNLPNVLKVKIENQLKRPKENEEPANQQMKETLEKKKILEESKVVMGKETLEVRAQIQKLREKEKGQTEIVPDKDDAIVKAEWPLAIRQHLDSATSSEQNTHICEDLYKFSEKWDEWIKVPDGIFLMGHPLQKDSAPHQEVIIEKAFLISKYPVTNVEFYKFISETQYKTEAEILINALVYHNDNLALHGSKGLDRNSFFLNPSLKPDKNAFWLCPDGQPDSLYGKYSHPVTQVTWNDAKAFCKWKSTKTGQIIRLPFENEWEYVASNFGKMSANQFFWDEDRAVEFCNIEETGICGTLPVDHFPENENCGGAAGLYGNVFEWVEDTKNLPENGRYSMSKDLTYKIARGGSFITHFKHIAPWRRISFNKSYCTSFLGFRTVCEDI